MDWFKQSDIARPPLVEWPAPIFKKYFFENHVYLIFIVVLNFSA